MGDQLNEENFQQQIDEIEALSSIYGDDWCCVDEASRVYCIGIDERPLGDGSSPSKWKVSFQVLLPDEYPQKSPPNYQLNAAWMRSEEKRRLSMSLEEIYSDNLGECIIYLWVETIREFLQNKLLPDTTEPGEITGSNLESASDEYHEEDLLQYVYDVDDYQEYVAVKKLVQNDRKSVDLSICPTIHHGEPMTDRRSTFQAHLAAVLTRQHTTMVIQQLYENKKIANATHNIYAYRLRVADSDNVITGCDDDGETHAGSRMLHLLKITDVENVLVVVSRWYGGIQLGPDRFKHINNCTRNILVQHNYISPNKNSASTSKKKR